MDTDFYKFSQKNPCLSVKSVSNSQKTPETSKIFRLVEKHRTLSKNRGGDQREEKDRLIAPILQAVGYG